MSKISKYRISDNLWECECGKQFNKAQSLNAHLSHCNYHHECLGTIRKLRPSELNHSMNWEDKNNDELKEIYKKRGKTYHQHVIEEIYIPVFKGKHHSEESKEKTRKSTINYIKSCKGECKPRYNKKACEYINKLNKQNNWNLQHAENGGEYSICGYFVDGYDKNLNIVFEYDEAVHYFNKENNILRDRDIQRQNNIIKELNCEFWRYNEYLDLLYKVN